MNYLIVIPDRAHLIRYIGFYYQTFTIVHWWQWLYLVRQTFTIVHWWQWLYLVQTFKHSRTVYIAELPTLVCLWLVCHSYYIFLGQS